MTYIRAAGIYPMEFLAENKRGKYYNLSIRLPLAKVVAHCNEQLGLENML